MQSCVKKHLIFTVCSDMNGLKYSLYNHKWFPGPRPLLMAAQKLINNLKKEKKSNSSKSHNPFKIPFIEIINSTIQFEDSRGPSDQHPGPDLLRTGVEFSVISLQPPKQTPPLCLSFFFFFMRAGQFGKSKSTSTK